jgi:hypothetical protein
MDKIKNLMSGEKKPTAPSDAQYEKANDMLVTSMEKCTCARAWCAPYGPLCNGNLASYY